MIESVETIAVSRATRLLPGETPDAAMGRRIRMHEFLMTGGVQTGYSKDGLMTYGPPITVATDPVCPWHGEDCAAWDEIVAGRGHWTRMEAELAEAQTALSELGNVESGEVVYLGRKIDELTAALEFRPRDALALRERSPEQIEAEKTEALRKRVKRNKALDEVAAAAKRMADAVTQGFSPAPKVYAAAGPKTGGNPWDRGPYVDQKTGEVFDRPSHALHKPTFKAPEKDSRNDAVAAFLGEEMPDAIVIEGDEEDE